jgi:hypothetical protein
MKRFNGSVHHGSSGTEIPRGHIENAKDDWPPCVGGCGLQDGADLCIGCQLLWQDDIQGDM